MAMGMAWKTVLEQFSPAHPRALRNRDWRAHALEPQSRRTGSRGGGFTIRTLRTMDAAPCDNPDGTFIAIWDDSDDESAAEPPAQAPALEDPVGFEALSDDLVIRALVRAPFSHGSTQ